MVVFTTGCVLLLIVALLIIWLPFFQRQQMDYACRHQTNVALYQQQLKTVDKQFAEHEPELKALKNELVLGLLTEEEEMPDKVHFQRKASLFLPLFMTIMVVGFSAIGYHYLGNSTQVKYHNQFGQDPLASFSHSDRFDQQFVRLKERIQNDPSDSEAWFILTEYYLYRDEFDNALMALGKAALIKGETDDVLAAKAIVFYYQSGQRITPQVQQLLDVVLKNEPQQITALMLIASDAYNTGRHQEAIDIWQSLLDSGNPQVDRIMLIQRINAAKVIVNRK